MRPNADTWTVVLVGQWNPSVFNPEWVARHFNDNRPVEAQLAAGPGMLGIAGWRVVVGDLLMVPSRDRLTLGTRVTTDDALRRVETTARRVLDLLPHTPLVAVGINFGFVETTPGEETRALATAPDLRRFAEQDYDVVTHGVQRSVRLEGEVLNTAVAFEVDGSLSAVVNIHREVVDLQPEGRAVACREALNNRVVRAKDQALAVLRNVYGLEVTEDAP